MKIVRTAAIACISVACASPDQADSFVKAGEIVCSSQSSLETFVSFGFRGDSKGLEFLVDNGHCAKLLDNVDASVISAGTTVGDFELPLGWSNVLLYGTKGEMAVWTLTGAVQQKD